MKIHRALPIAMLLTLALSTTASSQSQKPQTQDTPLDNRAIQTGPLRVVVVGLVHGHAEGFFSASVKRTDISILGIAEPDRALFDQYAKKYGLDAKLYHADFVEMLNATHPQAVLIYTNTAEHRKVVEACAKFSETAHAKQLTLMMEKPLAISSEDAHAMANAANAAKMIVLVNYFTTWEPSRHAAYEIATDGQLGDVRKIVAHDGHMGPKEIGVGPEFLNWLTDPKLNGGGALYDFGCYGIDFMTWVMHGERPLTVTAVTQQIKPDVYPKVEDEATIILTYPEAQGIIQASWNWAIGRSDVEVYGRTGQAKSIGSAALEVRKAGDKQAQQVQAKPLVPPMDDELHYLSAVVRGEIKPEGPGSLETNIVVAEILDAARESAKSGKTIKLK
jgi:glucose-fructose oxidoreductase